MFGYALVLFTFLHNGAVGQMWVDDVMYLSEKHCEITRKNFEKKSKGLITGLCVKRDSL